MVAVRKYFILENRKEGRKMTGVLVEMAIFDSTFISLLSIRNRIDYKE